MINSQCPFCDILEDRKLIENNLAFGIPDNFPVTPFHSLVIPKRHVAYYFDLTESEIIACNRILKSLKVAIAKVDPTVVGFNIGVNAGLSAGQTIFHCHVHVIPRRDGDVENPKGGVRGVIPQKQSY